MVRKVDLRIKRKYSTDDKRTDRVKKAERNRMVKLREEKTVEEIAAALKRSERTVSKQLKIAERL